jgi:hypothetical protein
VTVDFKTVASQNGACTYQCMKLHDKDESYQNFVYFVRPSGQYWFYEGKTGYNKKIERAQCLKVPDM